MKLANIKFNPNNPRVIKDLAFEKLCNSIKEFPKMLEMRPIVVDADGMVLGGNMRLKALQHLGFKEIPDTWVKRADQLTEDEKRRFIITDNVSGGEWDWEELQQNWDVNELDSWGLDVPDWGEEIPEAKEDDYEIPDEIETDIVLGDLFEIGEHRLLCGDSTDSDAVARLMDRDKADMVFTDPPYDLIDLSYTDMLFMFVDGHVFILNSEQRNVDISTKHRELLTRWYAVDFRQAHLISNNAPMTRADFIAEFRNSEKVKFYNKNKGFSTLLQIAKIHRGKGETRHGQEKKIELPYIFIEHHTLESNIVLDLFLGSGSTMVAAHQLNRKCYGMELDPKYCQVIIDRMKKLDPDIKIKKL